MEHYETARYEGIVTKMKLITSSLVYVQLQTKDTLVNAYVHYKPLTFIWKVEVGTFLRTFGHFNQKQHYIIDKYFVRHEELLEPMRHFPHKRLYNPDKE